MNQKWSELKKQRKVVSKRAEIAARADFEAYLVENDPCAAPDEIAGAKSAKRRARLGHTKEHRELLHNIGTFLLECGIEPNKDIAYFVFNALPSRPRPGRGHHSSPAARVPPGGP